MQDSLIRLLVVSALLIAIGNSTAIASPETTISEFLEGKRSKFDTKGHEKAKGLSMKISYPSSWVAKEGERPNIVQKFISEGGTGLEMVLIITKSLQHPGGEKPTKGEIKDFLSPSEMKDTLPPGSKFIDAKETNIENLDASILEYSMSLERAGERVLMHTVTYTFVVDSTLVQVQCQVAGPPNAQPSVQERMEKFRSLFKLIANSIVIDSRWK